MKSTWEMDPKWKSARKDSPGIGKDLFDAGLLGLETIIGSIDDMISTSSVSSRKKCLHECMDPMMDCYPCGPLESDTDLKLEARLGERRILSILVENNSKTKQSLTVEVSKIMDACGNLLDQDGSILFAPDELSLNAGECRRVQIAVNVQPPFQDSSIYLAEIKILGSCVEEIITLALWVQPDNYVDHLVLTDDCRPGKGRFYEFRNCECGCCAEGKIYYICCEEERRQRQKVAAN